MFDRHSNILFKSKVTAEQLDAAMRDIRPDHKLKGSLQAMVIAEQEYGISSIFIAAHAATETGWGNSLIARTKNNLFGFNAVDSNPGNANKYPSQSASVQAYAKFLNDNYLHEGGKYYNGATPSGVMTRYASAGDRAADTIANIMNMLATRIGYNPDPTPDGFPERTPKEPKEKPEEPPKVEEKKEVETDEQRPDADTEQQQPVEKKRQKTK